MTLFHKPNLLEANKKRVVIPITMNAIALMVFVVLFLTSALVHADHLIEQSLNVEQQECYICHQGLDTPAELPKIQTPFVVSSYLRVAKAVTAEFKLNSFIQPQLRAPPTFQ